MFKPSANILSAACIVLLCSLSAIECNQGSNGGSNDANIFSDLWSTLTQSGKAPSCPGECIHAITSIFCDNVLEEISCGSTYLRCCVPSDFSYGTPVETSPPLGHDIDKLYTVTNSPINHTTSSWSTTYSSTPPSASSSERPPTTATTRRPESQPTTEKTTTTTITAHMHPECPGVCIKVEYAKYCGNIMSNGRCESDNEACCLQSETDQINITAPVKVKSSVKPLSISELSAPERVITESATNTERPEPEVPLPPCEGNCVAPLFSLLCDDVDHDKHCSNGGVCCVNKEPTTTPPPLPNCPGSCIPTFLSGITCNRPSELIPKTADCFSGTICCKAPEPDTSSESPEAEIQHNKHDYSESQPQSIHVPPPARKPVTVSNPPPQLTSLFANGPPPPSYGHGLPFVPPRPNRPFLTTLLQGALAPSRPQPAPPTAPQFQAPPPPPQPSPIALQPPKQQLFVVPPQLPPFHSVNVAGAQPDVLTEEVMVKPPEPVLLPSPPQHEIFGLPPQPQSPQFCPGPCMSPMMQDSSCNVLSGNYLCPKPGQLCCAALQPPQIEPEKFESALPIEPDSSNLDNGPVLITKHNLTAIIAETTTTTSTTTTTPAPIVLPMSSLPVKPPPRKPNPYTCGVKGTHRQVSPRIVGGSDAQPGEWCWQIALINAQNQYLCGGALIGTQWVVTAAHCITTLVRNGEEIYIRVGDYDLTNTIVSKTAQTQKVSTTYIHHNHNSQTLDNDIALLKMEQPVELNEGVCLVCLPARNAGRKAGKKCTVTGYGYTSEAGPIALKIREAAVPVVDDQDCTVKINAVTEKLFILPASSFCAGGVSDDACQGDGGGPLVCEQDGFYELNGLVSWGFGCGRPDVPAVYVKVSSFIGWINQIISVNNNN